MTRCLLLHWVPYIVLSAPLPMFNIIFLMLLLVSFSEQCSWPFWSSAGFLIISSLLQTTSPLVTKRLLAYIGSAYAAAKSDGRIETPGVGRGIGLAFGLFAMQEIASLCSNQYMYVFMTA